MDSIDAPTLCTIWVIILEPLFLWLVSGYRWPFTWMMFIGSVPTCATHILSQEAHQCVLVYGGMYM